LNQEDFAVSKFDENDIVFKNSDRYILADIPQVLAGGTRLKLDTRYNKPSIRFRINAPTNIFFGVLSHYPNPIPASFEDTGFTTSILEIDPKKIKATTVSHNKIINFIEKNLRY